MVDDDPECRYCDGSGCPECIPNWEEDEQIRLAEEAEEQRRIDAWEEDEIDAQIEQAQIDDVHAP
jgi:hypothetical protein